MNFIKLSIIIPCLNEAKNISQTLLRLQNLRSRGHEIILCDGGSTDNTPELAEQLVDHCIHSPTGRASQMNAGAKIASGEIFCFLHADTLAPESIDELILATLNTNKIWGFFNIKLNNTRWQYRTIEWLINKRSYLTQIASGDQGIFIRRKIFNKLGGFSEIPLMEDIEISKRLKKITRPACITKHKLITSSRRWEKHGIIRTVLLMWRLRFAYFTGTPASTLAKAYKNH